MAAVFPSDIQNLQYYMSFQFKSYARDTSSLGGINNGSVGALGQNIILPMPERINDNPTQNWGEDKIPINEVLGGIAGLIPGVGAVASTLQNASPYTGYFTGKIPNPFLVMLYKQPNFKRFNFSWTLAPKNQQESQNLNDIVKEFKNNMLPSSEGNFFGTSNQLKYPNVVTPSFQPNSKYLFNFKDCAIESVNVDYTGAGIPAFFKNSQAPAEIKLRISLIEIDYWLQGQDI